MVKINIIYENVQESEEEKQKRKNTQFTLQKIKFISFNGKDKTSTMKYSVLVLLVYFMIFVEIK